jgi:antitoxin Phd
MSDRQEFDGNNLRARGRRLSPGSRRDRTCGCGFVLTFCGRALRAGVVPSHTGRLTTARETPYSRQKFWLEGIRAMPRRKWSVQDAKNRFSEVVEAARREPQAVTKHGKPAVVVVAVDEYERLRKLQHLKAPSFAALLLAMPTDDEEFERLEGRMREPGF